MIDITAGEPVTAVIPDDGVIRLLAPNLPLSGNGKIVVEVLGQEDDELAGRITCFVEGRREDGPRRVEIDASPAIGRRCRISLPLWGEVSTSKD